MVRRFMARMASISNVPKKIVNMINEATIGSLTAFVNDEISTTEIDAATAVKKAIAKCSTTSMALVSYSTDTS